MPRRQKKSPPAGKARAPKPSRRLTLIPPTKPGAETEAVRNTRAALMKAGKTLFARQGYDGTSVKEIAELAGVNISLVSYHFGGKGNLYRAILLEFGQERMEHARRVLQIDGPNEEFRVRAKLFAEEVLICHLNDPELAAILHSACELGVPLAQDVFRETFLQVFETFARFIAAAQKRGMVNPKARTETLSGLLFGSLLHAARADKLNEVFLNQTLRNPGYRADVVEHFLELAFPSPVGLSRIKEPVP